MLSLHARWVLPIASPPIEHGWVAVQDGRVVAIGSERRRVARGGSAADADLGRVALLPGLVNCHTHLELCWLAGLVPPAQRLTDWIRSVMARRREQPDPAAPSILDAMRSSISSMREAGTVLAGDVSNTLVSVDALADGDLAAAVFFELIRFRGDEADAALADARDRVAAVTTHPDVRLALAAHSPYSVSPRLFQHLARTLAGSPASVTSIHVGESPEERDLLRDGTGPWRELLEDLGAWDPHWEPPGCGPVEYLDRLGVLGPRLLAVHGVDLSDDELRTLADRGVTLVTCPRSNAHVGAGDPPVERFYASGVRVAVGTDSLASVPDLTLWPELAALRRLAPGVPAARLLESATRTGAEALGFAGEFGTIEPGGRADLVAVSVPPGVEEVAEVEEYLVSGVEPDRVTVFRY